MAGEKTVRHVGRRRETSDAGLDRGADAITRLPLGGLRPDACPEELEQVVGETDHGPLGCHLGQATQREAAEAAHFFDLPEDRLDDRLTLAVNSVADRRAQLLPHPLGHRVSDLRVAARGAVAHAIRWDVEIDRGELGRAKIGVTEKAGIRHRDGRQPTHVRLHLLEHRDKRCGVVGRLTQAAGDDDLPVAVYSRLRAVRLLEALRRMVLHDPRIGVGKVAIIAVWLRALAWIVMASSATWPGVTRPAR